MGKGVEGGMQWEAAVSRYKLLYIETRLVCKGLTVFRINIQLFPQLP